MEDGRTKLGFDEFEKLLGEIPNATSGNTHSEESRPKRVSISYSMSPICVNSCKGPSTEKLENNGSLDEGKIWSICLNSHQWWWLVFEFGIGDWYLMLLKMAVVFLDWFFSFFLFTNLGFIFLVVWLWFSVHHHFQIQSPPSILEMDGENGIWKCFFFFFFIFITIYFFM